VLPGVNHVKKRGAVVVSVCHKSINQATNDNNN
jgi:hypothetical protein